MILPVFCRLLCGHVNNNILYLIEKFQRVDIIINNIYKHIQAEQMTEANSYLSKTFYTSKCTVT